jgi:hypothetical protein
METDIKIQLVEAEINSGKTIEIKEALDKDYKYLVGLAIPDGVCSDKSTLSAKVKGVEFLPTDFEAVNIISSKSVEPNKRFFTLFNAVEINGDNLIINFTDLLFRSRYDLKIQVLLTNNLKEIKDVLDS